MRKIILFIIIFLLIGGYMIKTTYNLNLKQPEDQKTFFAKFVSWSFQVGKNIKEISGQAVKQEWLPKNETNKTFILFEK